MQVTPDTRNAPRTATVDGKPVSSLFVDLCPSPHGPAHLISNDGGTVEFSRVFLFATETDAAPHFQLGSGNDKLGPCSIVRCEVVTGSHLRLFAHDGRRVDVPYNIVRSLTYKPIA